ncbi:hypothetical protein [uncultured Lactobacillus sp.]|uniref:hypothetical protein n=1 Tax=uncultured Lactobacillus sp. TaxID=153152 RepID=UPI0028038744|nr:hypothetical protein [uncultured Lactobacillus sp.]
MQQFYLIKQLNGQWLSDKLAEEYLDKEREINPLILEPLSWILVTLQNIKLDENGNFSTLKRKINSNGESYYCIEESYFSQITQQEVKYEIIKKLKIVDHVYEVRFQSKSTRTPLRNCRVIITVNERKNYTIWTHGFTKFPGANSAERQRVKAQTNRLANLAQVLYVQINNHSDVDYIGKRGQNHEVKFRS